MSVLEGLALAKAASDREAQVEAERKAYGILRVALRNAIFRTTDSDTDCDPSWIFRNIEAGCMDVGNATDVLEDLLRQLGNKRWLDGVEGTAVAMLSEAG